MRIFLFVLASISIFLQSCEKSSYTERKVVLSDSTSFYAVSVEYPEEKWDKDGVMKAFLTKRYESKREEWKTGGAVYEEEQKITRAFPDRAAIKYTYDTEFETSLADSLGYVSYLYTTYEYTGGANGNVTVNSFTFSKDKKQVNIQDILDFNDFKDIELSKLLAETALSDTTLFFKDFVYDGLGLSYLKSDGKTLDKTKCNCDGFFYGSNFQNFVIKNGGITFYFDKYAIAPGVAGVTHIFLPSQKLKPYLLPSFKLNK